MESYLHAMTWVQKIQVIKAPYLLPFILTKRCTENKICTLYVKNILYKFLMYVYMF